MVDYVDPGEDHLEVCRDHLLQRDQDGVVTVLELEEPADQLGRDLDPGEDIGRSLGVAEGDGEAEREVRDVGDRPTEPDDQRGQGGKDLLFEATIGLLAQHRIELLHRGDPDSLPGEGRKDRVEQAGVQPPVEFQGSIPDRLDLLSRREPIRSTGIDPGVDLVPEAGHPDHEELVEVRRIDRAELDPLQEGQVDLLSNLEDPLVEVEPGELPVEEQRWIAVLTCLAHVRITP